MGDASAATVFQGACAPPIRARQQAHQVMYANQLMGTCSITGARCDSSLRVFADDVNKTLVVQDLTSSR
eukprot:4562085-Pyramimonas_sp.AAC.1